MFKQNKNSNENPQNIANEHNQFCKEFAPGQKTTKDCLGESYVEARFPRVVPKNGEYIFVTHEKKRTDLYPSEKHPNVTNLCFLGYFGLNKSKGGFDDKNKSFVMGSLGNENPNYIANYNKIGITDLKQKLEGNEKNKEALKDYLEGVDKYAKLGFRLDLAGKDNVVMNSNESGSEIVINNSAAKMESITTLEENLTKINSGNGNYSRREVVEIMNQIAGIVNINVLCDLVDRPKIYNFEVKMINLISKTLNNWDNLYIDK